MASRCGKAETTGQRETMSDAELGSAAARAAAQVPSTDEHRSLGDGGGSSSVRCKAWERRTLPVTGGCPGMTRAIAVRSFVSAGNSAGISASTLARRFQ